MEFEPTPLFTPLGCDVVIKGKDWSRLRKTQGVYEVVPPSYGVITYVHFYGIFGEFLKESSDPNFSQPLLPSPPLLFID